MGHRNIEAKEYQITCEARLKEIDGMNLIGTSNFKSQ